ncbi:MAG: hypothetical protein ACP5JG_11370, partial [Anaerolineae bacterium]
MTKRSARRLGFSRLKAWGIPFGLTVLFLTLYFAFRSTSLDDFDSYSFALALDHFDLTLQQPQPPGFTVYVILGRLLRHFTSSPTTALTSLSVISGVTAVLLTYAVGRQLVPHHPLAAGLAALLFGLVPVSWLTSEKALSDMPGLAWTLLALWVWHSWRTQAPSTQVLTHRWALPAAAGLVTGIALGVRPQNALPMALLIAGLFISDLACRRPLMPWLVAASTSLAATALWLLPTVATVGSIEGYARIVLAHAAHVGRSDALLGTTAPIVGALRSRALAFGDVLLTSLITDGLYPPLERQTVVRLAMVTAFVIPGVLKADWRRVEIRWLGVWALV